MVLSVEEMLRLQYDLLGHEGLGYTSIRVLQEGKIVAALLARDRAGFILSALQIMKEYPKANIFVGLNPRRETGKEDLNNISYITVLMLDVDPVRPTGEASTDEQHDEAIKFGREVSADIPGSVLVDSGSGSHVYIPVEPQQILDDPKYVTKQLEIYHRQLREKYDRKDKRFRIDATFDLPRVTRLWGSYNPKSHRTCVPLSPVSHISRTRLDLGAVEVPHESQRCFASPAEERFAKLLESNETLKKIMAHEGSYPSPSEASYAFVSLLTKAQFATSDIKRLVRNVPYLRESQKSDEQIDKDVERIVEKIASDGIGSTSLLHGGSKYLADLKGRRTGYSTGLEKLDQMLAGIQRKKLYALGARTNEGKTSFITQLAYKLVAAAIPTLIFPTELGAEPLFDKILAQATGINLRKFQTGNFTDEERSKIDKEMETLRDLPFIVFQDFGLTLETIKRKTLEICPGVVIVDYLQAMKFENGGEPKELAQVVVGLRRLAEESNIPVILCSQLNRSAINSEMSLSQLKGSGAIEESADVVIFLSTLSKFDYPRPVDLYIMKSRYSETGKIKLNFYSSIGKFEEAS